MANECYCSALRAASRKATAVYDAALAPVGITVAQYRLLRTVAGSAPLSMTALGRVVGLDRSTIGRNVKRLETMGLVQLTPGADQREATVTLGDTAAEIIRRAVPLWNAAQRQIETSLGPATAVQLRSLLLAFST